MEEQKELKLFDDLVRELLKTKKLEEAGSDIFFFPSISSKRTMAFIAATHGEEAIAVRVFRELLEKIKEGSFEPKTSFYLILGNRKAYEKKVRFVEEDLNRSYHLKSDSYEGKRAREIASILDQCDFCLDIHQTVHETSRSFLITSKGAQEKPLFSLFPKELPAVLVEEKGDLSTSRSYMASQGKFGLTLELGDKGFDQESLQLGARILEEALTFDETKEQKVSRELYQPLCRGAFPGGKVVKWKEGLKNFDLIEEGELLGSVDEKEIRAEGSGVILLYPAKFFQWKKQPDTLYVICVSSFGYASR